MRSGIKILEDDPGPGPLVERQQSYKVRLRIWLPKGELLKHSEPPANRGNILEDEGSAWVGRIEIHRGRLAGLFDGMEGMRVGGRRKLKISPHLAYGKDGTPTILGNAALTIEITILEEWRWP